MTVPTSVHQLVKSQTSPLPSLCRPTFHYPTIAYEFIWLIFYRNVIVKLLAFTLAMVIGPIGTYFLTLNTVFKGMLARLEGKYVTWDDVDIDGRKLYICRCNGGCYGERGACGLRGCCHEGGSE